MLYTCVLFKGSSPNSCVSGLSHPQPGVGGSVCQQHVPPLPSSPHCAAHLSSTVATPSPSPDGSRPQKLPIKYCPKALPSPRRKSGNNMPVSPLARTPSPSRTKSVNASPSLVTSEGGSGVTVLQRRGGGAITCPPSSVTGGPQNRNLHQLPPTSVGNVASTTYPSSPSPSPPIKSSETPHLTFASPPASDNNNSRISCESSPPKVPENSCYSYSVPPPVPARQPVTLTYSNPPPGTAAANSASGRPSSPIVAPPQVAKPFASSSPAVLRTILPPKSEPTTPQQPVHTNIAGSSVVGGTVLPTTFCSSSSNSAILNAIQPPATVPISTTSSSCPQIGPFTSPFSSPLQNVHAQSSSLPNSPNIIRVVSSSTSPPRNNFPPATSSVSSATTSVRIDATSSCSTYNNPRLLPEPSSAASQGLGGATATGIGSGNGASSSGATASVGIRNAILCPPATKPCVPPRSPSSWANHTAPYISILTRRPSFCLEKACCWASARRFINFNRLVAVIVDKWIKSYSIVYFYPFTTTQLTIWRHLCQVSPIISNSLRQLRISRRGGLCSVSKKSSASKQTNSTSLICLWSCRRSAPPAHCMLSFPLTLPSPCSSHCDILKSILSCNIAKININLIWWLQKQLFMLKKSHW